jgi:threonine/homoserine/homoserine lactone efflux protein
LYSAFVLAVALLMLMPGPNVALIVANSVTHGWRHGLLTVAGTSSAMVVQLGLTWLGMAALLGALGGWFAALRWIGVAYLVYLGIRQWRAVPIDLTATAPPAASARAVYLRGLLVSLTNPKTLAFYGAFFPQFIRLDRSVGAQTAILAATFLGLALLIDGAWAILAARLRGVLAARGRLRNRVSGGVLVAAGAALALARQR